MGGNPNQGLTTAMLIDGEKWACEACVRGHRVSSCHHSDRPLTHINKKGRPVSQCTHCRGLRKSRTTHVKCECGDKKKKADSPDGHGEKRDLKQDSLHRCGCSHGQRCTCALKKEPHLDPVPETGLPVPHPSVPAELPRKPLLTSTKSESTLTIFRDGHHKPAHKHNDMAHKCGLPYTIPRSHTIHHPSDMPRRSVDHLPLTSHQSSFVQEPLSLSMDPRPQSQQTSQSGSPNSAPAAGPDDTANHPPLDASYLDKFAAPALPTAGIENKPAENGSTPTSAPAHMDKYPLDQIITTVPPPLDVSSFANFPTTTSNSPITCMAFQDPYQEPYFTSPDSEMPQGSNGMGAPSVDWSSFPLYSDVPASTSTQTPSYASFDYNSYPSGLPPPSSSGDISEVDEFGPLPGLGHTGSNDVHDLHSVSEASDMDHLRISSASSLVGLPQTQLLSSNDLESINIDDFLKSANESTAALEHRLQASMGIESKPIPAQDIYTLPQSQDPVPVWPTSLFDESTPPVDDGYFRQSWAQ
ncbi:hypothetical protein N7532_008664 [Penicillium argentinense]|uniref:Copper-fist domain-containing protein n=1 Tax=Penicillium argentinense TaxID=1131581 RepID=A0A9W9EY32_9EURO|nr:uncharacterized protein N7532_008664 [Penicillium argentinense]KAJ5089980.1 hypothetical protein N7532_008664 [Penicillium argentinense]